MIQEYAEALKKEGKLPKEKIDQTVAFFSQQIGSETPLDRFLNIYARIIPEGTPITPELQSSLEAHLRFVLERSFDQQIENPEQFVSHGFDHTLNVIGYTASIIENNPKLLETTQKKYHLSDPNKAAFLLLNVALFHDFGYPSQSAAGLGKVTHALAGADVYAFGLTQKRTDEGKIEKVSVHQVFEELVGVPDEYRLAFSHDFRDAILFHNADKVETSYSVKMKTTRGDFLTSPKDFIRVITTFKEDEQHPSKLEEIQIFASKDEIEKLQEQLMKDLTQAGVKIPKIVFVDQSMKGRKVDLAKKGDQLIGAQFAPVDLLKDPLLATIRIADNMDVRMSRLTPIQQHPLFCAVYHALGDQSDPFCRPSLILEQLQKTKDVDSQLVREVFNKAIAELIEASQRPGFSPELAAKLKKEMELKDPKACYNQWKRCLLLFLSGKEEFKELSPKTYEEIFRVGVQLSSFDMRHFGGCEPMQDVRLLSDGTVQVTADRTVLERLNKTKVDEMSTDEQGESHKISGIGVGDYQTWRMEEAYRSITLDGKPLQIRVVDIAGEKIEKS